LREVRRHLADSKSISTVLLVAFDIAMFNVLSETATDSA
jgi:hypothetical protein